MSPDAISRRRFIEGSALAATAFTLAPGREAAAATGPGVGLLGEAMHAEVGYQHDLRAIKFETKAAAQAMGVNRGDQFDQQGVSTDFDVYDAASWSCMVELTAKSVASRSRALDVPDFTRGLWKTRPPLGIVCG